MNIGLLTRFLSPAVLAAMAHAEQHPVPAKRSANTDIHIETITKYICPGCDEEHDYHRDAVECCSENRASSGSEQLASPCPVCKKDCEDIHDAANCCLWKDLMPLARFNIAVDVERGVEWVDAIAKHAAEVMP